MSLRRKAWQLPLRLAAGRFVVNSGLSKWGSDEATAKNLAGLPQVHARCWVRSARSCSSAHCLRVRSPSEPRCWFRSCLPGWTGRILGRPGRALPPHARYAE